MKDDIIKIEGIDIVRNEKQILSNITFKIPQGEFVYLVGDTGSGKSSLLKALYAEIMVKTGNIEVANTDLKSIHHNEIPLLRRKLGIVFQDFQLLTDRTVEANLEFVLKVTGWKNKNKIKDKIAYVLESVYLENVKDKLPFELSGGEQQRAVIARALLNSPEIILADEPTGNLDPNKAEKIIQLLKEINQKGTTVLIATHNYSIIKKHISRTLKCVDKKLIEIDPKTL